jgi:hypothetical protein
MKRKLWRTLCINVFMPAHIYSHTNVHAHKHARTQTCTHTWFKSRTDIHIKPCHAQGRSFLLLVTKDMNKNFSSRFEPTMNLNFRIDYMDWVLFECACVCVRVFIDVRACAWTWLVLILIFVSFSEHTKTPHKHTEIQTYKHTNREIHKYLPKESLVVLHMLKHLNGYDTIECKPCRHLCSV